MEKKTPKSFKFSSTTVRYLRKLKELPEYRSETGVIEMLVYTEAKSRGLAKNGKPNTRRYSRK